MRRNKVWAVKLRKQITECTMAGEIYEINYICVPDSGLEGD